MQSTFIQAAKNGRNDIVKILLEHLDKTKIEVDPGRKTALHYAAENSESSVKLKSLFFLFKRNLLNVFARQSKF